MTPRSEFDYAISQKNRISIAGSLGNIQSDQILNVSEPRFVAVDGPVVGIVQYGPAWSAFSVGLIGA
jgi:hypothetical protein